VSVLDASAALEFLLGTAAGRAVEARLLSVRAFAAPELLPFEVLAVLRRHERRGVLTAQRGTDALADLHQLPLTLFSTRALLWRAWELRHNFTAADAMYVALAEALEEPLLTGDQPLARAVHRHTDVAIDLVA
jgi:predicted nucleic acid-binding protein